MQKKLFSLSITDSPGINWKSAIADIVVAGMVVGPLFAPFFLPLGLASTSRYCRDYLCDGMRLSTARYGAGLMPPFTMAVCMLLCYNGIADYNLRNTLFGGFYWLTQYMDSAT